MAPPANNRVVVDERSAADAYNANQARLHLRRKAVEFDEADADGDQEVDFEEFCDYILPKTGERSEEDLKEWWSLMDVDGDGLLRKDEFFLYALCAASRKSGSGIAAIFRKYDEDGSGELDEIEFEQALEEMGFGDVATVVFEEHAGADGMTDAASVSYHEMLQAVEAKTNLPAMRSFLIALASDSMIKVDTSAWSFTGETPEEARVALAALLKQHAVRLSDIFQQLDDDGSFSLSHAELHDAFWELGFKGDRAVVDELFDKLDQDGSGKAGFDEFAAWLHGRTITAKPKASDVAAKLSLAGRIQASFAAGEEAWSAGRLRRELFDTLTQAGLRCTDLLRAWDTGTKGETAGRRSDNQISHKEFLVSMKRLCGGADGLAASVDADGVEQLSSDDLWYGMTKDAAVDAFAKMDRSGDRSISVTEMQRWLDPHAKLLQAGSPLKRRRSATFAPGLEAELDPTPCYSPTKLSTRLAMVRAFEPKTEDSSRRRAARRPPLRAAAGPMAPNVVRERVWSSRRSESEHRVGPSSKTGL